MQHPRHGRRDHRTVNRSDSACMEKSENDAEYRKAYPQASPQKRIKKTERPGHRLRKTEDASVAVGI